MESVGAKVAGKDAVTVIVENDETAGTIRVTADTVIMVANHGAITKVNRVDMTVIANRDTMDENANAITKPPIQ